MNRGLVIAGVIALLAPRAAWADEIPMIAGHFVHEKVFTLVLTAQQVAALEQQRKRGQRLYRVPLILNTPQINEIERQSGKRINRLSIFEGDWTDCSCQAHDIASRTDKNVLEVPVSYLLTEAEAAKRHAQPRR